ncbi:Glutathione S-transferase U9 [Vitis vinifera]|uniref:Glutathione S-transferase U9 n=1 Tax=Vitis vinifera TaxID=29760 RepID=A0A438I198_VITVI|nr:Glutathione S-transferase U9 [Vitis vinifera]
MGKHKRKPSRHCAVFMICAHKAQEEALGVKFIDPEIYPPVYSWVTALTELAVVKEFRPPHEKLVEILQFVRQSALQSSAA